MLAVKRLYITCLQPDVNATDPSQSISMKRDINIIPLEANKFRRY